MKTKSKSELDKCYDKFEKEEILFDLTDDEDKFSHNWRMWVRDNHPDRKINIKDTKKKKKITEKFQKMSDCKDKIYDDLYNPDLKYTLENLMDEIDESELSKHENITQGIDLLNMLYNYTNNLLEHTVDQDDYIAIKMINSIIIGLILVTERLFKSPGQVGGGSKKETSMDPFSKAFSSMNIQSSSPVMVPAEVLESQLQQIEIMNRLLDVHQKKLMSDLEYKNKQTEYNRLRFDIGVHYITMIMGLLIGPFIAYKVYELLDLTFVDIARVLNQGAKDMNFKLHDIFYKQTNFVSRFILDKTIGFSEIVKMTSSKFLQSVEIIKQIITALILLIFVIIYKIFFFGNRIAVDKAVDNAYNLNTPKHSQNVRSLRKSPRRRLSIKK